MAQYTVKSGDTLSGIAKSLGLSSYSALSGYRSGNPNLIYPGETLNYGGATPAPVAAAPATPAVDPLKTFVDSQKAASDALIARQNAEQEGLFGNYETIRKNQEALPALYSRLQNEAGIPGLSEAAQGFKNEIYKVKDRLDRLSEDVTARTSGTLTTEAQRSRLETAEAAPLETNLSRLGTGLAPISDMLTSANQSVSTQMELQADQQERELEPIKLRINAISDKFAREITGFTANRELELTGILDKLERDRELSDREWELAQTLAAEERDFSRQKALAASSLGSGTYLGGDNTTTTQTTTPTSTYRALPSLPTPAPTFNDYASKQAATGSGTPYALPKSTVKTPVKTSLNNLNPFNVGVLK
jgi:hypothetical protein